MLPLDTSNEKRGAGGLQTLYDLSKQVLIPLIISVVIGVYNVLQRSEQSESLLRTNIEVTSQLSQAVTDLRIQMATFSEKYVTRTELERKLGASYGVRSSNNHQPISVNKPTGD